MENFKGKGLKPILVFTLVVHVVVILGSSIPYFFKMAFARDNSKRSETERIESAVEDATSALRKIAKKHGLNPQDISDQFGGRRPKAGKAPAETSGTDEPSEAPDGTPDREKSAYETNLEAKVQGPAVPTFDDDEDDIF